MDQILLNVHINAIEVGAYQGVSIPEDLKMDRKSHNEKIKTIMFHSRHSNGIRAKFVKCLHERCRLRNDPYPT